MKNYIYLGTVREMTSDGRACLMQKNKFSVGESIEIMKPDGRDIPAKVLSITDTEGNAQESAPHPKQELRLMLDCPAEPGDILRKEEPDSGAKEM